MSDTRRLFLGIEPSEPVRAALVTLQERLGRSNPPVRWSDRAGLHVTVQFLGATDPALLPAITAAMEATLATHRPFQLCLGPAGVFPNQHHPHAVWGGVGGALPELARLRSDLASALAPLGFVLEARPFHPHLTFALARRDATPAQLAQLGAAALALPVPAALEWLVERVVLFESIFTPAGSRYAACAAVALAGS